MNGSVKDYYKVLGADENADIKTLKKKYRKLAQQYHPDRNQGDASAEERFKEISEAYSILSDSDKRAEYDMIRKGGQLGGFGFHSSHFNDIFSSMFGGNPFQQHAQAKKKQKQNKDPVINVKIPLSEMKSGVLTKSFKIKLSVTCEGCNGKGGDYTERCKACDGLGNIYKNARQGNTFFQNVSSCQTCAGRGKVISGLCKSCHGSGAVTKDEIYDMSINCKLRK